VKSKDELAAEQAAFWKGPGSKMWLAAYERIQRGVTGFGDAALAATDPRPGEKVVDIGCGTGDTTAMLAKAVGERGYVLGVDIAETLVAVAREKKLSNATFDVGDATSFPFEAGAFDLVFSRFGVMFFADPVAAFRNLRRALKPGGRLVFVCWRMPAENPWALVPMRAAAPHLPPIDRPGPEDPGQYSFGDRARVERILIQAGFATPTFQPLDEMLTQGKDIPDVLERIVEFGPLARLFKESTPEQVEKAKAAIADALKPYVTPEGVRLAGACWLVTAAHS
jgi:ubiquinone/menaquinone biosynthesis C-methylase UbiE